MAHNEQKPKRVGIMHHSAWEFGGVEVCILLLLQYIDRTRYEPVVIIPGYYYNLPKPQQFRDEVQKLGVPLLATPAVNSRTPGLSYLQFVQKTRAFFKKSGIDLLHIHINTPGEGLKISLAVWLAGLPILRTEHTPPSTFMMPSTKRNAQLIDRLTQRIVTVSEADRREQLELLKRSPRKVYRCYNGIDLSHFNPTRAVGSAKVELGLDPAVPTVGLVGRLAPNKGHIYLIEAAPSIIKEFGPVNFLIVGDGSFVKEGNLPQELKARVKALGLGQYFKFTGFVPDHIPYFEAMDIAVIPSLSESFGLVLTEYMAMRKPIVATNLAPFQEIVEDGQSALIVPVKNSEAIAAAVLKLLRDPQLAENLAQSAYERVQAKFSIQRNVADTMSLYDQLLGLPTPS